MLGKSTEQRTFHQHLWNWLQVGSFKADVAFQLDQLSMVFVLLITGVGSLIHIYSIGYMAHDENRRKFSPTEPVPGRDAGAGSGGQLPAAVRRLGGRRSGVVPVIGFWQHKPTAAAAAKRRSSSTASVTSGCRSP